MKYLSEDLKRYKGIENFEKGTVMIENITISVENSYFPNIYRLTARDTETHEIVGYSELRGLDKPVPVFFCEVKKEYMGRSIGGELLKQTILFAKERSCEGIFVRFDGNIRAKMLLKKNKFEFFSSKIALLEL